MSINFGHKINHLPLLISFVGGILLSSFLFVVYRNTMISIIFGIICLVVILALYTLKTQDNLNRWWIDDHGVHYYDYSTMSKRVRAILLPSTSKEETVKFNEIKEFSVIIGKEMDLPQGIGPDGPIDYTFYLVDSAAQTFNSPYYLSLKLPKSRDVNLNLSGDAQNAIKIKQVIKKVEEKTNLHVKLEKQRV